MEMTERLTLMNSAVADLAPLGRFQVAEWFANRQKAFAVLELDAPRVVPGEEGLEMPPAHAPNPPGASRPDLVPEPEPSPVEAPAADPRGQENALKVWFVTTLDERVLGVVPPKKGGTPALEGEIPIAKMHNWAVEDGAPLNCPEGCKGGRKNCSLRTLRRVFAQDEGFPLRLVRAQRGVWGGQYVYEGFDQG